MRYSCGPFGFCFAFLGRSVNPGFANHEGAIQMAANPVTNSNSKHIDVRHHVLRGNVENREFDICFVEPKYPVSYTHLTLPTIYSV